MRPLAYFAFTLLSVVIQFCVMDFIQENFEVDENPIAYNETINERFMSILNNEQDETNLALYYRSRNDTYEKIKEFTLTKHPNSSHNVTITTTDLAFTVFDVYDENTTTDAPYTTELITSTELDNVTEITLFEKTSTTARPVPGTKNIRPGDVCYCNLLYKQCDINCCCDEECSLADKQLFDKCKNLYAHKKQHPLACGETSTSVGFGNLVCIAKTNLPEQRAVVKKQVDEVIINNVFLWQHKDKQAENSFNRNIYKAGAPVWILRNKSIYYLDLPGSFVNNYCGVRRKMTFLRDDKINCQVKLKDLEMFRVLKVVEDSTVISVTNNSMNHTFMNCSSLYCTNWTIVYCDQDICVAYNKSLHAPICMEIGCTNVALKMEYAFYIYDKKIVNATIKLYARNVTRMEYVTQDVDVKFHIGIPSERVVTLSGNPGYITGSPLIASFTESNHSDNFFNSSIQDNYISYAENNGGLCVLTKLIKKNIEFGINKRIKCRIILKPTGTTNASESCISIQRNIHKMAAVDRKMHVSPYGNPDNIKDDTWLPVKLKSEFVYGEYKKRSKLQCFNIHTRVAFVFMYADLSDITEENKLLDVRVDGSASNVTLEADVYTSVITIDINFVNVRSAARRELAGPPHLNLNLPRNFFFPFPSNASSTNRWNIYLIFYSLVATLFF